MATMQRIEFQAKLAEQAERYDEMVEFVSKMAQLHDRLNVEQRNLLSVAFKNVVGARRASWRALLAAETEEEKRANRTDGADAAAATARRDSLNRFRVNRVEKELKNICRQLLDLVSSHLMPYEVTGEGKVFYFKMEGDYYRYLSEVSDGAERTKFASSAQEKYEAAKKEAERVMAATHPIRLGLALNYSVFYYEILNKPQEACALAKDAFDAAMSELDGLADDDYKDATLIMQLIRDNLTLWTSDNAEDAGGDDA